MRSIDLYRTVILVMGLQIISTKRIAIIGCGAAGSSAAYFLQGYNVTIFEKDQHCGGRASHFMIPDSKQLFISTESQKVELGASLFVEENRYFKHFVDLTGQNYSRNNLDSTIGIVDGINDRTEIVFQTSSSDIITLAKLLYNYGLSPIKIKNLAEKHLSKFLEIYKFQDEGHVFQDYAEFQKIIGLDNASSQTIAEFLVKSGISEGFIEDFVAGIVSSIYNQDYKKINAVAGIISIIATYQKTYSVDGGNDRVFQSLIDDIIDVDVRYNTIVTEIKKDPENNYYNLTFSTNSTSQQVEQFEIVILATLINKNNNIVLPKGDLPSFNYDEKNHQSAQVYVVAGRINTSYFDLSNEGQIPKMLLSRNLNQTLFADFQLVCQSCYNKSLPVYKIQTQNNLTSQDLSKLFSFYNVLSHKIWTPAYPSLSVITNLSSFKLDNNLYYINSIEYLASCMETQMISAKNIANHIRQQDNINQTQNNNIQKVNIDL